MKTNVLIGQTIAERRKALKLTQAELADYSNVSERTLLSIEKGQGNPTLNQLNKILSILGLKLVIKAING